MLVLVDRDGVLNEDRPDFVKTPEELVFIPGSLEAVARLNSHGYKVVIVTNQSCIGRGLINEERLAEIHGKLHAGLSAVGGHVDYIFVAPDAPWAATEMRKPGAGMVRAALEKFRVRANDAVLIGDTAGDMKAAKTAGCRRILVRTGKGAATQAAGLDRDLLPVRVAANLSEAVRFILDEKA
ncbi:MAG: D-glycero-beta-D-manno-heptose-1,7-bisphosphate 7-phosphatase [Sneathiella sp.]|nr:MAG: D-glycero-beta-D-manno-heptose-1,7-bisphosphate 7-phosphatase [Sneathiella sp.]